MTVPPAVLIIGWSNSGKTTVAAALIEELTGRGFRVGAIKHTPHGLHERIVEHDGSDQEPAPDSVRLFEAGAARSITSGPTEVTVTHCVPDERPLGDLLRDYGDDLDLFVIEGYKREPLPRVVVSSAEPLSPQADSAGRVIAIVGAGESAIDAPRVSADDTGAIADLVTRELHLRPAS